MNRTTSSRPSASSRPHPAYRLRPPHAHSAKTFLSVAAMCRARSPSERLAPESRLPTAYFRESISGHRYRQVAPFDCCCSRRNRNQQSAHPRDLGDPGSEQLPHILTCRPDSCSKNRPSIYGSREGREAFFKIIFPSLSTPILPHLNLPLVDPRQHCGFLESSRRKFVNWRGVEQCLCGSEGESRKVDFYN